MYREHLEEWKAARARHRDREQERKGWAAREAGLRRDFEAQRQDWHRDYPPEDARGTTDDDDSPPSGGWGCLPIVLGLAALVLVLGVVYVLSSLVGFPLASWRQVAYATADPNAPALVILIIGSVVVLLTLGMVLAINWPFWLLQAINPARISTASFGRWVAVIALIGGALVGIYGLVQDRTRLISGTRVLPLEIALGLIIILPLLLWVIRGAFGVARGQNADDLWEGLESLPRSITRQLERKGLVPVGASFGLVYPPSWVRPVALGSEQGEWAGSGWIVGDDCSVTFAFSKAGGSNGGLAPPSPTRGWRVTGSKTEFSAPAIRGSRQVPSTEGWSGPIRNDHPGNVANPLDVVPRTAWMKVAPLTVSRDHPYKISLVHEGSRLGYRYTARSEGDGEIIAIMAERSRSLTRRQAQDVDRVFKELLEQPWTVTFIRGRIRGDACD